MTDHGAATMSGWRLYAVNQRGMFSPFWMGETEPVEPTQDASCRCEPRCARIPSTEGRCGWYVTAHVRDLRPLAIAFQRAADRPGTDPLRDLLDLHHTALVGVELTDPLHAPPVFKDSEQRKLARVAGVIIEGHGTYRGRRVSITGPVVTTLQDPEALAALRTAYDTELLTTRMRMVDLLDVLAQAAQTHGSTPQALAPHLAALAAADPTTRQQQPPTRRKPMATRTAATAPRKPATRAAATRPRDHLPPATPPAPGYQTVPLLDVAVRVKPFEEWRTSAVRAVKDGDFDLWAEGVLHPDDVPTFLDLDLTMGELMRFVAAVTNQLQSSRR